MNILHLVVLDLNTETSCFFRLQEPRQEEEPQVRPLQVQAEEEGGREGEGYWRQYKTGWKQGVQPASISFP